MIQVETDEFSINVPIKRRMHAEEFLRIAESLEKVQKAQNMPRVDHNSPAAYTLEHGEELHRIHAQLQSQMEQIRAQEEHIANILDYLEKLENRRQQF